MVRTGRKELVRSSEESTGESAHEREQQLHEKIFEYLLRGLADNWNDMKVCDLGRAKKSGTVLSYTIVCICAKNPHTYTTASEHRLPIDSEITLSSLLRQLHHVFVAALLIEFWKTLKKEHKKGEAVYKLTTVRDLANKWQFLEPVLQTYQKDERLYKVDETRAVKTDIAVLFVEMDVFQTYWKDQFDLANSKQIGSSKKTKK